MPDPDCKIAKRRLPGNLSFPGTGRITAPRACRLAAVWAALCALLLAGCAGGSAPSGVPSTGTIQLLSATLSESATPQPTAQPEAVLTPPLPVPTRPAATRTPLVSPGSALPLSTGNAPLCSAGKDSACSAATGTAGLNTASAPGTALIVTKSTPALSLDTWRAFPVIPAVSGTAREIYRRGQERGRSPAAFAKVGDCESRTTWFLADFDMGAKYYNLGEYEDLQAVIDHFSGSFGRLSQVAKPGFTAASLLTPLWADPKVCEKDETPLACEYRQQNPAFALVMLGTNDIARPETFEANMRRVIEFTIAQDIVPVLVTKADNLEGDHAINRTIAALAVEFDLPLWNFWAAVQDLPDRGLQDDGAHLTWSPNDFSDPQNMLRAWPVRNLTALQLLDALWKGVQDEGAQKR